MLPRILEPEVMDSAEEARDYDAMDHHAVNAVFVDDLLAAATADELQSGASVRVIDIGTGTAQIPIELCRRPVSVHVTGVDLAGHMLQLALRNVISAGLRSAIRLEHVDAKDLPFGDASFDWVISNSIVHHIPEPLHVLQEMLRVLRPGGLLFIRDLLRPESREQLETLVATYAANDNEHQRKMFADSLHAALTLEEVRELLEQTGLDPAWASQTSDRHWTIRGRKPLD